jgi:hypothetical protein
MSTLETPQIHPVATPLQIAESEAAMSNRFPPLLVRLYREIANGGFGPGGGLIGVRGGYPDAEGRTVEQTYNSFVACGAPKNFLPLWDWGDAAWSGIDLESPDARVVTHDESGPTYTAFTLKTWLESWCNGVNLFESIFELVPATVTNPFTHQPVHFEQRGRAKGSKVQ